MAADVFEPPYEMAESSDGEAPAESCGELSAARRAFNMAVRDGMIQQSPLRNVRPFGGDNARDRALCPGGIRGDPGGVPIVLKLQRTSDR